MAETSARGKSKFHILKFDGIWKLVLQDPKHCEMIKRCAKWGRFYYTNWIKGWSNVCFKNHECAGLQSRSTASSGRGSEPTAPLWGNMKQGHPMDRFSEPLRYGSLGGLIWVKVTAENGMWGLG